MSLRPNHTAPVTDASNRMCKILLSGLDIEAPRTRAARQAENKRRERVAQLPAGRWDGFFEAPRASPPDSDASTPKTVSPMRDLELERALPLLIPGSVQDQTEFDYKLFDPSKLSEILTMMTQDGVVVRSGPGQFALSSVAAPSGAPVLDSFVQFGRNSMARLLGAGTSNSSYLVSPETVPVAISSLYSRANLSLIHI